jgi:hypothetical protein
MLDAVRQFSLVELSSMALDFFFSFSSTSYSNNRDLPELVNWNDIEQKAKEIV